VVETMPAGQVVSLSTGSNGSLWVATPDDIYWRMPADAQWKLIGEPLRQRLENCLIQAICCQITHHGADEVTTLWVGTSRGLFSYLPEFRRLGDPVEGDLAQLSIQSLVLDPLTNHLWVGSAEGLFSEHSFQCHRAGDVRALAFGPLPQAELWVGTAEQLEQWPAPGRGEVFANKPSAVFSALMVGLAAEEVTSLAVRLTDNHQREVWIGSPTGVSCYRYST